MAAEPAAEVFRFNVRCMLDDKGLSISDLARGIGTSPASVSNVLSGKEGVTVSRAERIAKFLGFSLASMLVEKFSRQSA